MIYLDSSVALARLLLEQTRPSIAFWRQPIVSSRLLEYEVWNRLHAEQQSQSHGDEARALLNRVRLIDLTPGVLARALNPFPVRLRTLDALHLATMEFIRARGQALELASYDKRLLAAAMALRIPAAL